MALIAKPTPVVSGHGHTTNRALVGPRNVSPSTHLGPIEPTHATSGTSTGDGMFASVVLQEEANYSGRSFLPGRQNHQNKDELPNPQTGVIEFTSQGFAELIELRDTVINSDGVIDINERAKARGHGLEYASSLYESVIEIADGTANTRGETISMML